MDGAPIAAIYWRTAGCPLVIVAMAAACRCLFMTIIPPALGSVSGFLYGVVACSADGAARTPAGIGGDVDGLCCGESGVGGLSRAMTGGGTIPGAGSAEGSAGGFSALASGARRRFIWIWHNEAQCCILCGVNENNHSCTKHDGIGCDMVDSMRKDVRIFDITRLWSVSIVCLPGPRMIRCSASFSSLLNSLPGAGHQSRQTNMESGKG